MPRKLRYAKARRDADALRPSILHFLETGETAMAEREINPWVVMSLMDRAALDARALWANGDTDGAVALLRRTPASHNLFNRAAGA